MARLSQRFHLALLPPIFRNVWPIVLNEERQHVCLTQCKQIILRIGRHQSQAQCEPLGVKSRATSVGQSCESMNDGGHLGRADAIYLSSCTDTLALCNTSNCQRTFANWRRRPWSERGRRLPCPLDLSLQACLGAAIAHRQS
jgi:hypothetical protein